MEALSIDFADVLTAEAFSLDRRQRKTFVTAVSANPVADRFGVHRFEDGFMDPVDASKDSRRMRPGHLAEFP
jgi:hypothetical protein